VVLGSAVATGSAAAGGEFLASGGCGSRAPPTCGGGGGGKNRLVIGRGFDLAKPGALGPSEFKLQWPTKMPDMRAEWKTNSGLLRQEMRNGRPIRDASPGELTSSKKGPFLNAERKLLKSRGWRFNRTSCLWLPPGR